MPGRYLCSTVRGNCMLPFCYCKVSKGVLLALICGSWRPPAVLFAHCYSVLVFHDYNVLCGCSCMRLVEHGACETGACFERLHAAVPLFSSAFIQQFKLWCSVTLHHSLKQNMAKSQAANSDRMQLYSTQNGLISPWTAHCQVIMASCEVVRLCACLAKQFESERQPGDALGLT